MAKITHPTIQDGWFRETNKLWPGQAWALKVDQILHHEKSQYHDILVFDSAEYGPILVVDNAVQCTQRDEFGYRELITHLAMNSHPDPKKVLVIGGADGGVLREVVKHTSVDSAILCDVDEAVIRVAKKYLPTMSIGFQHPSVNVKIEDGFHFLRDRVNEFDVIIVNSLDAQGPAQAIFQEQYLKLLNTALKEGGIFAAQVENLWINLSLLAGLRKSCLSIFPQFEYAYAAIPSQLAGQIGMLICCKDKKRNLKEPLRSWSAEEEEALCKYYNKDIHIAAFVLPSFVSASLR